MGSELIDQYIRDFIQGGADFDPATWFERIQKNKRAEKQGLIESVGPPLSMPTLPIPTSTVQFRGKCFRAIATKPPVVRRLAAQRSTARSPKGRLRRKLENLSVNFQSSQKSRTRDSIYKYLGAVYETVRHYRRRKRTKFLSEIACGYAGLTCDQSPHIFSTVIRATCDDAVNGKIVSKWSRALRYAALSKVPCEDLKSFMKQHDGLNGCASAYARHRRCRNKSRR